MEAPLRGIEKIDLGVNDCPPQDGLGLGFVNEPLIDNEIRSCSCAEKRKRVKRSDEQVSKVRSVDTVGCPAVVLDAGFAERVTPRHGVEPVRCDALEPDGWKVRRLRQADPKSGLGW